MSSASSLRIERHSSEAAFWSGRAGQRHGSISSTAVSAGGRRSPQRCQRRAVALARHRGTRARRAWRADQANVEVSAQPAAAPAEVYLGDARSTDDRGAFRNCSAWDRAGTGSVPARVCAFSRPRTSAIFRFERAIPPRSSTRTPSPWCWRERTSEGLTSAGTAQSRFQNHRHRDRLVGIARRARADQPGHPRQEQLVFERH